MRLGMVAIMVHQMATVILLIAYFPNSMKVNPPCNFPIRNASVSLTQNKQYGMHVRLTQIIRQLRMHPHCSKNDTRKDQEVWLVRVLSFLVMPSITTLAQPPRTPGSPKE